MNLIFANKKFVKILFIFIAILFLWVAIFGLAQHMNEMKLSGMTEGGCLFDGSNEVCNMNFLEHMAFWGNMFASLPQTFEIFGLFVLLTILVVVFIWGKEKLKDFYRRISSRFRIYSKQHPQINLFDYLREVFSSGILNTKKYKLALI